MNKLAPFFDRIEEYVRNNDPHLMSVQIDVTHTCYSKCKSCRQYEWPITRLSLEAIEKICKEATELGCKTFVISGGEPFAHPQIIELLNIVNSYGKVGFITSAILPRRRLDELSKTGFQCEWIMASLDGWDRGSYQHIRGVDAWDQVIEFIAEFKKFTKRMRTNTVISNLNYKHLTEIYRLSIDTLGCDQALFTPVHTWEEMMLTEEQWDYVEASIYRHMKHFGELDMTKTNLGFVDKLRKQVDLAPICMIPFIHAVVDGYGYVYPCCRMSDDNGNFRNFQYAYGNIAEKSLKEMVREHAKDFYRAPQSIDICKSCDRYREHNTAYYEYQTQLKRPVFL